MEEEEMATTRSQRAKINPNHDASYYCSLGEDKEGFDVKYIKSYKGRGVFSCRHFQKGDFLIEYRGEVISRKEQENRLEVYHDALKVFMFDFQFNGQQLCVDAAREDGSLGRLVNDDWVNPNSKMKVTRVDGRPHLCLFALKDIGPGEEITYNYGDSDWPWRTKISKEVLCQAADVDACRSLSDNTIEISKEVLGQAADVDACRSLSGNSVEISKEVLCQSAVMDACKSFSGNSPELSIENPCQAANVYPWRSFSENTSEDCNHDLIPDEMSSFEKCVTCGGPFSPLKWSGVRCKACNQSWHKKCYLKNKEDITELELVYTEHSSSEVASSEEEYVPDSIDDSNSSWDDKSDPLKISHKQVQNCEVSPSKSSSKKKRLHQESFVEEDRESISEAAESLSEDVISTSQLEVSKVTSKVGNTDAEGIIGDADADGSAEKVSNTSSLLRKKTYCYICGKLQTKFTRHLKTHEKTHADVAQVLSLPKRSKKCMKMLIKLRNKGNHSHNSEVLASGVGSLKLRRTSKNKYNAKDYIHCIYCQALYVRRDLWRHVRKCSSNPVEVTPEIGRRKVLSLASMNESALCQQISPGVWNMLAGMKDDEITSTVRSDFSILQLAQSFFNKYGPDHTKYDYIRQRLRESGRLLLTLRKEFSIHTLEDAVRPANFDVVIKAVKVSGYDEEKHCYHTPSLALKLGHSLQKVSDILHCRALMAQDSMLIKSTQSFKTLYATKWSELISHTALTTLNERHFNKPSTLPFTEDVQRLHRHLEKITEQALKDLENNSSPKSYGELCKATMANVILFNRRRGGEISKMMMSGFLEGDTSALHKDVAFGLTEFERHLCQHFSRVELRCKRGRKVAVLLSPDMVNAITRLIEKREDCGVLAENQFLFAQPHCLTPYRGQDCLRLYASECGAENPELS